MDILRVKDDVALWLVVRGQTDTLGCALRSVLNSRHVLQFSAECPHPLMDGLHIKLASTPAGAPVAILRECALDESRLWNALAHALSKGGGKVDAYRSATITSTHDNCQARVVLSGFTYAHANALRRGLLELVPGAYAAYEGVVTKNCTLLTEEALCRRISHLPLLVDASLRGDSHENEEVLKLCVSGRAGCVTSDDITCSDASILGWPKGIDLFPITSTQEVDVAFKVRRRSPSKHALYRSVSFATYVDHMHLKPNPDCTWDGKRLESLAGRLDYLFNTASFAVDRGKVTIAKDLKRGIQASYKCHVDAILQSSLEDKDDVAPISAVCTDDHLYIDVETDGRYGAREMCISAVDALAKMLTDFAHHLHSGVFTNVTAAEAFSFSLE